MFVNCRFCSKHVLLRRAGAMVARYVFLRWDTRGVAMRILLATLLFLGGFGTDALAQTLKSGDNLSISVLQDPKLDRQVIVDPNGQIRFRWPDMFGRVASQLRPWKIS